MTKVNWEREFDERFVNLTDEDDSLTILSREECEKVKAFISQALARAREETRRETLEEAIKVVPSQWFKSKTMSPIFDARADGFNLCREEIFTNLRSLAKGNRE